MEKNKFEIKGEKELLSLIKDDLTAEDKNLSTVAIEVGFSFGRLYPKLEMLKLNPDEWLVPAIREWIDDEFYTDEITYLISVALGVGYELGKLYDSSDKDLLQNSYDALMSKLK
jgi:hypothetical protein